MFLMTVFKGKNQFMLGLVAWQCSVFNAKFALRMVSSSFLNDCQRNVGLPQTQISRDSKTLVWWGSLLKTINLNCLNIGRPCKTSEVACSLDLPAIDHMICFKGVYSVRFPFCNAQPQPQVLTFMLSSLTAWHAVLTPVGFEVKPWGRPASPLLSLTKWIEKSRPRPAWSMSF